MNIFEITIQRKHKKDNWFVVVEHTIPGQLPIRRESILKLNSDDNFAELGEFLFEPKRYGEMLGDALFDRNINGAFERAFASISNDNLESDNNPSCLHILLHIEDEELRQLRWEKLCVPWHGGDNWDYLLLNQKTPLSIYIPSTTNESFPAFGRRDLQALVVAASPEGLGNIHLASFDVQATVSSIKASLGDIPCDVLATVDGAVGLPTVANLMQCLANNDKYYNVLHLVCHGQLLANGETAIYLTNESNQVAPVKATELITQLRRSRRLPHFAFLSTCESASAEAEVTKINEAKQAQIGEVQAIGGLAQRLVRELGMPAVVAMTEAISIKTAEALAATFYKQLRQHGYVDLALVEATAGLQGRPDITVPALFSRLGGRPLFSDTLDRPLTKKEIEFGLERLQKLLVGEGEEEEKQGRSPVLAEKLEKHIATIQRTLNADSDKAIEEKDKALAEVRRISLEALDLSFENLALDKPVPSYDARCPFQGLYPFRYEDREFFCGRGELIEELQQKLREHNFLPVLGASGSGKSSVVMAGLIPALQQKETQLVMAYMTPKVDPLAQLATSLAQVQNQPYILVVDQFEEVFTLCNDKDKRENFIDELLKLAQNQRVILTMRADFWGECAIYAELRDLMEKQQKLIAPMNTAELRNAIDEQAKKVGLRFEVDLLNKILDDLKKQPGAMPLLQHALLELWKRRHGKWLLSQEYREMGGVEESIAKTADDFYDELSSEEKDLVQGIFVRLTQLDENALQGQERRDTRQRVESETLISANRDSGVIKNLVKQLADKRLVITSVNETTGKDEVEVAHEALITHWSRLSCWLDENRGKGILRQRIGREAQNWKNAGNKEDFLLLQGSRLQDAVELLPEFSRDSLNPLEKDYVLACQQLQEQNDVRTKTQLINAWSALSEVCLFKNEQLEALIYALKAGRLLQQIQQSPLLEKTFTVNIVALLYLIFDKVRERNRLRHQSWVNSVSFSPDSKLVATASGDCTAKLWDINTAEEVAILQHKDFVSRVSFSPDGKLVATASCDNIAKLWDITTLQEIAQLQHQHFTSNEGAQVKNLKFFYHQLFNCTMSFSPDGKLVATVSHKDAVKLWDIRGQQVAQLQHQERVISVSFSPDSKLVATTSYNNIAKLWDISTGQKIAQLQHQVQHDDYVIMVNFSPDSKLVATASADNMAKLWDISTGQEIAQLQHQSQVYNVCFSPNGELVATTSDNTATLWNISTGQKIAQLQHQSRVYSVCFSPNGELVATASADNMAKLWDISTGQEKAQLQHQSPVYNVCFSPNGELVATASADNMAKWRDSTGQEIAQLQHQSQVYNVCSSPNGELVTTASYNNTATLWNINTNQTIAQLQHKDYIISLSFSPDSKHVVTTSHDNTTKLINTGEEVLQLQNQSQVYNVCFSPNGELVATTLKNNTATLWNINTNQTIAHLQHNASIISLSFSPKGKLVATASDDYTAKLWDINTGEEVAQLQHKDFVKSVCFSPNGKLVATGSVRTAILWDISTGEEVAQLRLRKSGYFQSISFSPDGKLLATNSLFGMSSAAILWDLTGKEVAQLQHQSRVYSVCFSPVDKLVATASDYTAKLWNINTGEEVAQLKHGSQVNSVCFSPDGKLVATTSDNIATLYINTGEEVAQLKHGSQVNSVCFSPKGKLVATASDYTAKLWDINTGKEVTQLQHQSQVYSVCFSPDGKLVATASDTRVKLWRTGWLDELLEWGCSWARDYITHNPEVNETDRRLILNGEF